MKKEPSAYKLKEVQDLKKLINSYSTIAIINMEHLPSKQLQNIRSIIKENVLIKMSKKSTPIPIRPIWNSLIEFPP